MVITPLIPIVLRWFGITVLCVMSVALSSEPAYGTGGGATYVSVFVPGTVNDADSREWINLVATNGLLSGRPRHSSIALITVYAPGIHTSHVILRVMESSGGKRALLLTAPASLAKATRRVTLYVKHRATGLALLENKAGTWQHSTPQELLSRAEDGLESSQGHLISFSVAGFGQYWLIEGHKVHKEPYHRDIPEQLIQQLSGNDMFRGLLLWACALVLLSGAWVCSRWLHYVEQKRII